MRSRVLLTGVLGLLILRMYVQIASGCVGRINQQAIGSAHLIMGSVTNQTFDIDLSNCNGLAQQRIQYLRGMVAVSGGAWAEAKLLFEANTNMPESGRDRLTLLGFGKALEGMGNHEAALEVWRQGDAEIFYSTQARALINARQWDDSIPLYEKSLEIDPTFVPALFGLGIAYRNENEWMLAQNIYERQIAVDPDNIDVRYHLGLAYLQSRNTQAAQAQAEAILMIEPTNMLGYLLQGHSARSAANYPEAVSWYEKLLLQPDARDRFLGYRFLGISAYGAQDYEAAVRYLTDGLDLMNAIEVSANDQAELLYYLGLSHAQLGHMQEAVSLLEKANLTLPTSTRYQLALGQLWEEVDDPEKARVVYENILLVEPKNQEAIEALAALATAEP